MIDYQKVENAFGWRHRPEVITNLKSGGGQTLEMAEAAWIGEKSWQEVSRKDWDSHSDAVFAFTPSAFQYFLPSIILRTLENLEEWFAPADTIVGVLDRSPTPAYWDEFLLERFGGLRIEEYEILQEWLVLLANANCVSTSDGLGRAFDTVELLIARSQMAHRRD